MIRLEFLMSMSGPTVGVYFLTTAGNRNFFLSDGLLFALTLRYGHPKTHFWAAVAVVGWRSTLGGHLDIATSVSILAFCQCRDRDMVMSCDRLKQRHLPTRYFLPNALAD